MTKRLLLLLPLAAAACVAKREVPPAPAPRPRPVPATPAPPPTPAPVPAPTGWADLPLTPGTWVYQNASSTSTATFGQPGAPVFRLYCEGPTRSIFLQRYGVTTGRVMTVRTSSGARNLAAEPLAEFATATLPARDAFLDEIIFSRGRFSVEVSGTPTLILPSWAEAARVVEDCRTKNT